LASAQTSAVRDQTIWVAPLKFLSIDARYGSTDHHEAPAVIEILSLARSPCGSGTPERGCLTTESV